MGYYSEPVPQPVALVIEVDHYVVLDVLRLVHLAPGDIELDRLPMRLGCVLVQPATQRGALR